MASVTETSPAQAMTGADAGVLPAPYPDQSYAWFVVGALSLTNMVSYVERQIPTLLFTPIKADFALNDTEVSLLAGFAFVVFYVAFGLVSGRLADRAKRQRIIAIGIVLWGLATMSCGLARSFIQLFLGRVLVGVGEATLGPSAISMLSDYFPREKLARALSLYTGAQYLGAGFALVVGGAAIQIVSDLPAPHLPVIGTLHPWQTTFLIVGALGMLVIVPMLFVKEPPRRGLMGGADAAQAVPFRETLAFMRLNWKTFTAHFAGFSISAAIGFGTVVWMPSYFIRVHHWAAHDIGYVYGLMLALLGGAGVLAGARFAEWLGRRYPDAYFRAPAITLSLTAIPGTLAVLMPTDGLAFAFLVVATFLSSFPVAVIIAALQVITPNQMRGQIVAMYFFLGNVLGLGVGPTIVAAITDYVFHDEMMVGASIATVTAVVTPIVVGLLIWGLKPYRESLARAAAWTGRT